MKSPWRPASPPVTTSATTRASAKTRTATTTRSASPWPELSSTRPACLLDFKLLKQVMRPVVDRIDHQMLNDLEPFTVLNPSAENIAKYFYDQTNEQLRGMTAGPRAREGLHHLGDRHHHGYLLRVAQRRGARGLMQPQFIWLDFDFRYCRRNLEVEQLFARRRRAACAGAAWRPQRMIELRHVVEQEAGARGVRLNHQSLVFKRVEVLLDLLVAGFGLELDGRQSAGHAGSSRPRAPCASSAAPHPPAPRPESCLRPRS